MTTDLSAARTLWISDLHLGSRECRADKLLLLAASLPYDWKGEIYLVGDVVDLWSMKKFWHWPAAHSLVIQKLLLASRRGVKITFIPGNHDEAAREYCGQSFGEIRIEQEAVHTTIDGRRVLVTHGDQYDSLLKRTLFVGDLLAWGAGLLSIISSHLNSLNWWPRVSLNDRIIRWFGGSGENAKVFRKTAISDANARGYDGIICGHIHEPEIIHNVGGVTYMNCGDWTENCTALVERESGQIDLIRF